jgi:hypothetical protein
MDEEPDVLSSGPQGDFRVRWPRPGRRGWTAILVLAVLLASLAVTVALALRVTHQDAAIGQLRQQLRNAPHPAPAATALPAVSGSATFRLPGAGDGSFSVVVVAVRPGPGSALLTWLFVYGQHTTPGQRYGLISDTCGGQYVAPSGIAEGTADRHGDLTMVVPSSGIDPLAPAAWIQLYRWADGTPLGGVQGPLTGSGARTFGSAPPC